MIITASLSLSVLIRAHTKHTNKHRTEIVTSMTLKRKCSDDNDDNSGVSHHELTRIDDQGDVILVVSADSDMTSYKLETRKLLVSSKVLSVASSYFKKLLAPHSIGGVGNRTGRRPEISLEEHSPEVVDIILHRLHFSDMRVWDDNFCPNLLEQIAKQCDKYACTDALCT